MTYIDIEIFVICLAILVLMCRLYFHYSYEQLAVACHVNFIASAATRDISQVSLLAHAPFSSDVQYQINEKSSIEVVDSQH